MTELKTLKDIEHEHPLDVTSINKAIRALAIKWVKAMALMEDITNKMLFFWMDFHNITEEDLK